MFAASLLASRHDTLPPTANHDVPDDDIHLDIPTSPHPLDGAAPFLTLSFAFGGQNAALVVTPRTA